MPVPLTTVINRRVAPVHVWQAHRKFRGRLRTSPFEQVPGKSTTRKGWSQIKDLLQQEDPEGSQVASILSQAAVPSLYAGAAIMTADGKIVVEGKAGEGDTFMQGTVPPETLPGEVHNKILGLYQRASSVLGAVRFEWVFDVTNGMVYSYTGAPPQRPNVLVPGDAEHWVVFEVQKDLEHLRTLISGLEPGAGLILRGEVGLTSHIADVIRRAGIPAKIGSTVLN